MSQDNVEVVRRWFELVETRVAYVLTLHDGKLARVGIFDTKAQAWKPVGWRE